jgi:hypothetical protein
MGGFREKPASFFMASGKAFNHGWAGMGKHPSTKLQASENNQTSIIKLQKVAVNATNGSSPICRNDLN